MMAGKKITPSSGNVFLDMGFDPAVAEVMALRAHLMIELEKTIRARGMTQVDAAKILKVSQGRVSDIKRGKVEKFSLDSLVEMSARLGRHARLVLSAA